MAEPNPEDMSLEQLEAAMLSEAAAPIPEPPAEPEPAQEVEVKSEEDPTEDEKKEEPTDPPPSAAEADEPPSEMDILKAQVSATQAKLDHYESVAGRHGRENGFLKQQLRDLQGRLTARTSGDEPEVEIDQAPAPRRDETDPVSKWAVKEAIISSARDFYQKFPDAQGMFEHMKPILESMEPERNSLLESNDPIEVHARSTDLLMEAYRGARSKVESERVTSLQTKRADQLSNLAKAKKLTGISKTGPAPTKSDAKKIEDMGVDELDRALAQETGGRW